MTRETSPARKQRERRQKNRTGYTRTGAQLQNINQIVTLSQTEPSRSLTAATTYTKPQAPTPWPVRPHKTCVLLRLPPLLLLPCPFPLSQSHASPLSSPAPQAHLRFRSSAFAVSSAHGPLPDSVHRLRNRTSREASRQHSAETPAYLLPFCFTSYSKIFYFV